MTVLRQILQKYRVGSTSEREKGTYFERLQLHLKDNRLSHCVFRIPPVWTALPGRAGMTDASMFA